MKNNLIQVVSDAARDDKAAHLGLAVLMDAHQNLDNALRVFDRITSGAADAKLRRKMERASNKAEAAREQLIKATYTFI